EVSHVLICHSTFRPPGGRYRPSAFSLIRVSIATSTLRRLPAASVSPVLSPGPPGGRDHCCLPFVQKVVCQYGEHRHFHSNTQRSSDATTILVFDRRQK